MSRTDYSIPEAEREELAATRRGYLAALRDWVQHGAASRFALSAQDARARLPDCSEDDALAAAHFGMGQHLYGLGREADAQAQFAEAKRLRPESWAFARQAWNLEHPLKSGGPEFWAAVDALGADRYYAPTDIPPA